MPHKQNPTKQQLQTLNIALPSMPPAAVENWVPVFFKADRVRDVWSLTQLTAEITHTHPSPRKVWFSALSGRGEYGIQPGRCHVSEHDGSLSFTNGRHRTRWMLDQGISEIPVFIKHSSYTAAIKHELISRRAFVGEPIPELTQPNNLD